MNDIYNQEELIEYINDFGTSRFFVRDHVTQEESFEYLTEIGFENEEFEEFFVEFLATCFNFEIVMYKSPIEVQQIYG